MTDLGCAGEKVVTADPPIPAVKPIREPYMPPRVVVPFPGPPGKDAEVVIEGEFNYTYEQQTPAKIWTFQNPLGRQITSCRVVYPTTTEGETVLTRWNTDGTTVIIEHGAPATGKAIIG